MGVQTAVVGVPHLDGRIDVQHAVIVTPGENLATVDVPGQVDEQVARREVLTQDRTEILRCDLPANKRHALAGPPL